MVEEYSYKIVIPTFQILFYFFTDLKVSERNRELRNENRVFPLVISQTFSRKRD